MGAGASAVGCAGWTAPKRYAPQRPPQDDAFAAFWSRPDISYYDTLKEWQKETRRIGKRQVSVWESFKNYRRVSLDHMHKATIMSAYFHRWRIGCEKLCTTRTATVSDILWSEERANRWMDSFFSFKSYEDHRKQHGIESHALPPSLLSLWVIVLQKHTRTWAKNWLDNELFDAKLGDHNIRLRGEDDVPVAVNNYVGSDWLYKLDVQLNRVAAAFVLEFAFVVHEGNRENLMRNLVGVAGIHWKVFTGCEQRWADKAIAFADATARKKQRLREAVSSTEPAPGLELFSWLPAGSGALSSALPPAPPAPPRAEASSKLQAAHKVASMSSPSPAPSPSSPLEPAFLPLGTVVPRQPLSAMPAYLTAPLIGLPANSDAPSSSLRHATVTSSCGAAPLQPLHADEEAPLTSPPLGLVAPKEASPAAPALGPAPLSQLLGSAEAPLASLRPASAAVPSAAMPLYLPVADQAAPLTSSLPVPTPSTPSAPGRLPLDVVERLSL